MLVHSPLLTHQVAERCGAKVERVRSGVAAFQAPLRTRRAAAAALLGYFATKRERYPMEPLIGGQFSFSLVDGRPLLREAWMRFGQLNPLRHRPTRCWHSSQRPRSDQKVQRLGSCQPCRPKKEDEDEVSASALDGKRRRDRTCQKLKSSFCGRA